jgi:ribosome recycling factor
MQDEMSRDATQRMSKCVALLKDHYRKMRTGRANTGLLDGLKVEYYGSEVPLSQVASINVEDSRTLVVSPWDKSAVPAVEKAILK